MRGARLFIVPRALIVLSLAASYFYVFYLYIPPPTHTQKVIVGFVLMHQQLLLAKPFRLSCCFLSHPFIITGASVLLPRCQFWCQAFHLGGFGFTLQDCIYTQRGAITGPVWSRLVCGNSRLPPRGGQLGIKHCASRETNKSYRKWRGSNLRVTLAVPLSSLFLFCFIYFFPQLYI